MDITTLLGFIFILGALIFIHESGHYFMAKLLGIRVEVFSLGFGPKLLRFRKGGTEYCISALPLGGYVKMLGESPDESLRGSPEEFQSRKKRERFLVLVMGALLNIVLAVVLMAGLFMHGVAEPLFKSQPPVVGGVLPDTAAQKGGLQAGDRILAINEERVATWRDMELIIALNPGKALDIAVQRDGETLTLPVTVGTDERDRIGVLGIVPKVRLAVHQVLAGGPAQAAGVQPGDVLLAVDGVEMEGSSSYETYLEHLTSRVGQPVALRVERQGEILELQVVPAARTEEGKVKGDAGILPGYQTGIRKYGPVEAVWHSLEHNWESAGVLFLTLKKLVAGQLSPRTLSGPIEIYRLTGESLRGGWITYVHLMALISLQLGIINLLPIPVLDGGHIFILLVEGVIRRDLSMKLKERVLQFGFILLLIIMGGVLYMDLYKYFHFGN